MNKGKLSQILVDYKYAILFGAILIVYFFNLFIDVMEIDAAQYALISMEMGWTKSFLHVYQQGQDYLDKPPLLFWLSSVSMLIFGINNFAYKLPSVLIGILGIYSTYRFAKHYYSKEKAIFSALILASSQAMFLITNDIRTDTNLLGLTMFSIWQLSEYLRNPKWKHLVISGFGIGCAMMAKGPIALIIPVAAFGADLFLKRQWNNIFKPQWIVLLILIGVTLIPMSWGLYTQFDLHPEKTAYGIQSPSGLRFFYWTQSFGRITGESSWDNGANFFTFFHTILWDFQPWILIFYPALIIRIVKVFKQRFKAADNQEFITLGGFVLIFLALSASGYKLPHYVFVLFPFASIITADFIFGLGDKLKVRVANIQFGIMHIFWAAIAINFVFFFPPKCFVLPLILAGAFVVNWKIFKGLENKNHKIIIPTVITAISLNLLMATNFYPNLLKYQATSQAGKYLLENEVPSDKIYQFNRKSYALDFYSQHITPAISLEEMSDETNNGKWVYTNHIGFDEMNKSGIEYKIIKEFPRFRVTALKLPFLVEKTRETKLTTEYLLEIQ